MPTMDDEGVFCVQHQWTFLLGSGWIYGLRGALKKTHSLQSLYQDTEKELWLTWFFDTHKSQLKFLYSALPSAMEASFSLSLTNTYSFCELQEKKSGIRVFQKDCARYGTESLEEKVQ